MKRLCIKNGRVVFPDKIEKTNILIENGKITGFLTVIPDGCKVLDAEGRLVTPGFIELHAHGGGGSDFCDLTEDAFINIIKTHLSHGTTLICPTLVSSSLDRILDTFNIYRNIKKSAYGRHMHKLHLEGPYLNPSMCGAQRRDIIRCPSKYEVDTIFDKGADIIGRISCAPEIKGIGYLIKKATENNIILSIAHSAATAEEAKMALDMGFFHITHLYSATTTVRKINQNVYAGILEAAYLYDDFYIELIGDGKHVAKETMQLALKIKSSGKINLTSDAMRAAGQSNISKSFLGEICSENRVIIDDNVAKLPDMSSYAGSIATGDIMFKNAVLNYDIPITDAVSMLSATPAKIIGETNKGSIEKGKDADIVIWNDDYSIFNIVYKGEIKNEI